MSREPCVTFRDNSGSSWHHLLPPSPLHHVSSSGDLALALGTMNLKFAVRQEPDPHKPSPPLILSTSFFSQDQNKPQTLLSH